MQLEIIRNHADFDELEAEWNELLKHSASHVPFLQHEYLSAWWATLGGGEWKDGELFVVTARQDGLLVGAAPLFFTHNLEHSPALMLLGSIEISDYLDLLVRPEALDAFIPALLDLLTGPQAPGWCAIDWYNLFEESPTLAALQSAAQQHGWEYHQEFLHPCPHIPLPGDWEQYLAGIDKKQRHEIRRKIRRAESYEKPVRWYIVSGEDDLDAEMEGFLTLMANDPEKEKFLTGPMRMQMKTAAQAALKAGWLQLAFLEVDGEKAAGYLNFDYENKIWVYNSGFHPGYGDLSVGWVLLGYLLEWANTNKRSEFDFMRGSESYKYRFGAVDRRIVRAVVKRPVRGESRE